MTENLLRLGAYGRLMCVERANDEWVVSYQTAEGKRWPAREVVIPAELDRDEMVAYLADLLHERATDRHPGVNILE